MKVQEYELCLSKSTGRSYVKKGKTHSGVTDLNLYSPRDVYKLIEEVYKASSQPEEHVYLLALGSKQKLIGVFHVSMGDVNTAILRPRELYLRALLVGASNVIVVHNHPSQDTTPSQDDINTTKRLKDAGKLLCMHLLDHIIIGDGYYSFKSSGSL